MSVPEIEQIIAEITKIRKVDIEEKEKILSSLKQEINYSQDQTIIEGGLEKANEFLKTSINPEVAEQITQKLNLTTLNDEFAKLEHAEPKTLASILSQGKCTSHSCSPSFYAA